MSLVPGNTWISDRIRNTIAEVIPDGSPAIHNYVIPGLTSYLLADNGQNGKIRMFHCTRNHNETIIPHNHRFNIASLVLCGSVTNEIYAPISYDAENTDWYVPVTLEFAGQAGKYTSKTQGEAARYRKTAATYKEGEWYYMNHIDIHSIRFAKGTQVLFFEGPQVSDSSLYLEPFTGGKMVETFDVKPWMFERKN